MMRSDKNKNLNKILGTTMVFVLFLIPFNNSLGLQMQLTDEEILEQTNPEFQKIKEEIESNQGRLEELQKQQKVYEENLKAKRNQINTLINQMEILDESVAKLAIQIETTELTVKKTGLEIQNLNLQISYKEGEIVKKQIEISEILKLMEKNDRQRNQLEILVLQGSLSQFLDEINKLESLDDSLGGQLSDFKSLKTDLENKKENLLARKSYLTNLQNELSAQKEKQDEESEVKNLLIIQTKGQEKTYQNLLAQAKREQAAIEGEIQSLEVEARKKLLENDGQLPENEQFIWPVASRKVTAGFHDQDYPFRHVFEHPAVDIGSTPQGSAIRAAKSGYVARVKYDGNSNYAYIMLVHPGGLSTVYGHISKPMIEADTYVVQGQIIALSGGSPGTVGAGRLTTGAHLHFEVRLNGIPVDPLNYLP